MAQNLDAQKQLLELLRLFMEGGIDYWLDARTLSKRKEEVEILGNALNDALEEKRAKAQPIESMCYFALEYGAKDMPFKLEEFENRYSAITGGNDFLTDVKETVYFKSLEQEKQDNFIKMYESHKEEKFNSSQVVSLISEFTPYMAENNQRLFNKVVETIQEQSQKDSTKNVIRIMLVNDSTGRSKFTEIANDLNPQDFSDSLNKLRELKGGLTSAATESVASLYFGSTVLQSSLELTTAVKEISDKVGLTKFVQQHTKLFDKHITGNVHIGLNDYNVKGISENFGKIEGNLQTSKFVNETTDITKNDAYLKALDAERKKTELKKQQEEAEKQRAEQMKINQQKAEEKAKRDAEYEAKKDNFLGKANKKMEKLLADEGNKSAEKQADIIKKACDILEKGCEDAKNDKKSLSTFMFNVDTKEYDNVKDFFSKFASPTAYKEKRELVDSLMVMSSIDESFKPYLDSINMNFRNSRCKTLEEKFYNTKMNYVESLREECNALEEKIDVIKPLDNNIEGVKAVISSVISSTKQLDNFQETIRKGSELYSQGIIEPRSFAFANMYHKPDVYEVDKFLKEASTEEIKETIKNTEAYSVLYGGKGLTKTLETMYEKIALRPDKNEFDFSKHAERHQPEPEIEKDTGLERTRTKQSND